MSEPGTNPLLQRLLERNKAAGVFDRGPWLERFDRQQSAGRRQTLVDRLHGRAASSSESPDVPVASTSSLHGLARAEAPSAILTRAPAFVASTPTIAIQRKSLSSADSQAGSVTRPRVRTVAKTSAATGEPLADQPKTRGATEFASKLYRRRDAVDAIGARTARDNEATSTRSSTDAPSPASSPAASSSIASASSVSRLMRKPDDGVHAAAVSKVERGQVTLPRARDLAISRSSNPDSSARVSTIGSTTPMLARAIDTFATNTLDKSRPDIAAPKVGAMLSSHSPVSSRIPPAITSRSPHSSSSSLVLHRAMAAPSAQTVTPISLSIPASATSKDQIPAEEETPPDVPASAPTHAISGDADLDWVVDEVSRRLLRRFEIEGERTGRRIWR